MHADSRPNPDRSSESLEARLRALAQPRVPADLEARLLATIPAEMPTPRRRWAVWAGVAASLAAASLVAMLPWPRDDGVTPVPRPPSSDVVRQATPRPAADSASIAAWREAGRGQDGAKALTFNWPLPETSLIRAGSSIPPDLLD
jgi:hypothetical protein